MIENIAPVERTILGQIVLYGEDAVYTAEEYISAADFEDSQSGEIYTAARELVLSGRKLDIILLEEKLGKEYRVTLVQLAESAVQLTKNTYETNLRVLQAKAKEKRMQEVVGRIVVKDYDDIPACRELLGEAMQCLDDKDDSSGTSAKDGFINFLSREKKPNEYAKTGMSKVDKYLKISAGDMIVVGGRPSAGKTAITIQMMINIAKTKKVVYFSLETSEEKIFDRAIACYTGKPLGEIKDSVDKDPRWWSDVTECYDRFSALNLQVVNAAGWTVSQIYAKAKREKAEVIFIDYIGLIKSKGNSPYEKASNVSNDVHTMSQRMKITTFALCQLNRGGKEKPDMTSLRDSGAVEQDADAIMLLSIPDPEESDRILELVKNKDGQCGAFSLKFAGEIQRFYEVDKRW